MGEQGFRDLTNSKLPATTPGDIKGLRIRVIPNDLFKLTFERLGTVVVPMDFNVLHQALLDGRVDGQENPPASVVSGGFQDVQHYMTLTHHVFGTVGVVMNVETYASLDPQDRKALAHSSWSPGGPSARSPIGRTPLPWCRCGSPACRGVRSTAA